LEGLEFQGVRSAGGLRDLGCEWGGDGVLACYVRSVIGWLVGREGAYCAGVVGAVVNWHVTASAVVVAVGEKLAHEVFEGEAALLEDACFAVLGEYDVVGGQGGCGANADALFSCGNLRGVRTVDYAG
jgi:hypothetical protein